MIDTLLRSIDTLPAFPATVQKVTQLLRDDDYSADEVANVIQYDQAITANILKMSNSAYFGVGQKINTIRGAVAFLGQKHLARAVQTAGVSKFYRKAARGYVTKAADLWEHSVAVALMSQILSRRIYNRENAVLYTAALLHDVGKVILGEYVYESFRKIMGLVSQEGYSFLEAEEKVIGINHGKLGGEIAARWNFPQEIRDAIACHHRPDLLEGNGSDIAWLVYLSDQSCLMMGLDGGADGLAHRSAGEGMKRFKLRNKDIEESFILLADELTHAREMVAIV